MDQNFSSQRLYGCPGLSGSRLEAIPLCIVMRDILPSGSGLHVHPEDWSIAHDHAQAVLDIPFAFKMVLEAPEIILKRNVHRWVTECLPNQARAAKIGMSSSAKSPIASR